MAAPQILLEPLELNEQESSKFIDTNASIAMDMPAPATGPVAMDMPAPATGPVAMDMPAPATGVRSRG